ncbi:MAG: DUF3365 domain-containing protein [Rhodobacterales bacterium]|nr:DUF3365 domain-containing protein [Rhodobacterales bacterium]
MKHSLRALPLAALALSALTLTPLAQAADPAALKQEAVANIKAFGGTLKGELVAAMKAGGPVNAIGVCNEKAPAIAASLSSPQGWTVARTSLKVRNTGNTPDAWEQAVLARFEERKAAGEDPDTLAFAEVVDRDGHKEYRFMKAIPTGEVCLKCHGAAIDPAVEAKLKVLYPDDKARGYAVGDLRGAFTLRKPVN